ncbi:3-oxoacyl-(acyl-carrier-protein) synthase III [Thermoanaerobacter mathranii subsp. mathranii str. A3]|uniref:Beta-ketoacyl-[acyl-carrier-protein] synthase III n=1 Tax=Thermoanaerobacter mathranii subsp. mathranii (strain DSM 11426 / CCUG 53645 / CIP 108742 / A3) TaxID=583358 RepID=A0ABN3Z2Q3_THEM3|nr:MULTISPECIES: beta-ketoacyl-ACP synthase III [Thermoanaerobacter]ADH61047.1 3-oxoacyl-(acyl-carrier-protein) synthase III [Thermoanaerobacter mathranii subsp. mathranii str. A3]MBT1279654.1 ketoacyl-ACP synthase III [Thermoanaerobacter sp. CM-CNRG TB177]MDK2815350.1 3-oxoacyl-[acyl-carrier-protein] synthase [Thermoanaerobacter sp.]
MGKKFAAGILGTGSYVPEKVLTNSDLEKMVDTSDEWITTRTGIKERRIADPSQAASDLGIEAARKALEDAKIAPSEIDMIIVATVTPDMNFPSTACIIQANLGASNAAAFDISVGCSGFIYGLAIAQQFVETGMYNKILVIGAETLSKITNWKDRNTCVLFGDGAGAAVVGRVESGYGILSTYLGADGTGGKHLYMPAGGSRMPASEETVKKNLHTIFMEGQEVFKFAVKVMDSATIEALNRCGLKPEDIDMLIPHQANTRIIEAARKRLKLSDDKVYINLDKYGNTSAASVAIALDEAYRKGLIKKGDIILTVAFGAGLTWGSSVIKWSK